MGIRIILRGVMGSSDGLRSFCFSLKLVTFYFVGGPLRFIYLFLWKNRIKMMNKKKVCGYLRKIVRVTCVGGKINLILCSTIKYEHFFWQKDL